MYSEWGDALCVAEEAGMCMILQWCTRVQNGSTHYYIFPTLIQAIQKTLMGRECVSISSKLRFKVKSRILHAFICFWKTPSFIRAI